MAAFEPSRAAITTKEAVFRVIIQEKMTEIWEVDIRHSQCRISPIDKVVIIVLLGLISPTSPVSLSATRTDLVCVHVWDTSSAGSRSQSFATRSQSETVSMCHDLLAFQLYQSHLVLSLRLTIMCDSNWMCGTDNISWQSRVWTAIIKA